MVGHTGNFEAAVKAIEFPDACLGRVAEAVLEVGGEMLITADHGNAEQMSDPLVGQPHTAHTTNAVPLIYVGDAAPSLMENGALCDVAPTLLQIMGLPQPAAMTGRSLLQAAEFSLDLIVLEPAAERIADDGSYRRAGGCRCAARTARGPAFAHQWSAGADEDQERRAE